MSHAILDLAWDTADSSFLYTASADHTARVWDVSTGDKLRKLKGHDDVVNSVDVLPHHSSEVVATGSDDGSALLWDLRQRQIIEDLPLGYPVTSVAFGQTAAGGYLFVGGLDNSIKAFNLRKGGSEPEYELLGHHDTITGLSVSHSGHFLLSNAMDMTLR